MSSSEFSNSSEVFKTLTEILKSEKSSAKRKMKIIEISIKANRLLLGANDENILFQNICDFLVEIDDIKMVWVGLLEKNSYNLIPTSCSGDFEQYIDLINVARDENKFCNDPCSKTAKTKHITLIEDAEADECFLPLRELIIKKGFKSIVSVPLIHNNELLGVLGIYFDKNLSFSENDLSFFDEIACEIAIRIKAIRLNKELENIKSDLFKSQTRYKLAIEGANDGMWDWNIETNEIFLSPRCKEMLGYSNKEIENSYNECRKLIHPSDLVTTSRLIFEHLEKKTPLFSNKIRFMTKSGDYKWILCRGKGSWDENGKSIGLTGSNTDISELIEKEREISYLSFHDPITSLPNKRHFEFVLKDYINYPQDKNNKIALIYLDIDNFKTINDSYGHTLGDKLLLEIANRLRRSLVITDFLAHFGGDEFMFIYSNFDEIIAVEKLAKSILSEITNPYYINNFEINITASIGIDVYPTDGVDVMTLVKNVDTAMYHAKELGKNNYQLFNHLLGLRVIEEVKLESELRNAIKNNELEIYYQPHVDSITHSILGMEALVRWNHPKDGFKPPIYFIPLAEKTGLIIPLEEYVLKTACTQAKKWHDLGYSNLNIAVNISARHLHEVNFLEKLIEIINKTGLSTKYLELEITETTAMIDFDFTLELLTRLKTFGIKISLDDFGKGYSSLSYLKKFPIDILKIDKSFIDEITYNLKEAAIGIAIINMAHALDLTLIAEGVEQKNQLLFLHDHGCDIIQGFLFSKPLPAIEFEKFLKDKHITCSLIEKA